MRAPFIVLGALGGMLTFFAYGLQGETKDFRPKRGGISGTCQGGHTGVSCQKEKEGGTCQWFYRRTKRRFIPKREGMGGTRQKKGWQEIHSKKRRNGRYASNGGCLGCRRFSFEQIDQLRFIIMIRSFAILIRLSNIKEDIFRVVLHFLWFAMGRKGTKRMVGGLKIGGCEPIERRRTE